MEETHKQLTKQHTNTHKLLSNYFQLLSTPINGVCQQVQPVHEAVRDVLLLLLPLEAPGVGVLQPLGQGQEGRLGVLPPAPRERVRLLPREGAHAQALPAARVARRAAQGARRSASANSARRVSPIHGAGARSSSRSARRRRSPRGRSASASPAATTSTRS